MKYMGIWEGNNRKDYVYSIEIGTDAILIAIAFCIDETISGFLTSIVDY